MIKDDWVYWEEGDLEFQVRARYGQFLMITEEQAVLAAACILLETEECQRCQRQVPEGQVSKRYSFTVYAGKMCDQCAWDGYRDHCGLDDGQGNPQDLDEPLGEDL